MRSLFIAAMLAATSARALEIGQAPTPFCLGEVEATVKVQAFLSAHDGAALTILEDDAAAAWLEEYNKIEPVSRFIADKLWAIANPEEDPGHMRVALFFRNNTCYNERMPMGEFEFITNKSRKNNH